MNPNVFLRAGDPGLPMTGAPRAFGFSSLEILGEHIFLHNHRFFNNDRESPNEFIFFVRGFWDRMNQIRVAVR